MCITLSLCIQSAPVVSASGRLSRSASQTQSLGHHTLRVDEEFVQNTMWSIYKSLPDHISLKYPLTDVLPATVLLVYFDEEVGRAALKAHYIHEHTVLFGTHHRCITASVAQTKEPVIKDFIKAARVYKLPARIDKQALLGALISGDYKKRSIERGRTHAVQSRLEERARAMEAKAARLEREATKLKLQRVKQDTKLRALRQRLAAADEKVVRYGFKLKVKANASAPMHAYPTRLSLTKSSVPQEREESPY